MTTTTGAVRMAAKKIAKAVAATKKVVKAASHGVAKEAKVAAKQAVAGVASLEKERSMPRVGDGAIGAPARDEAVAPAWAQDAELRERVATHLGLSAPAGSPAQDAGASPAPSQAPAQAGPIAGRTVGVLVGEGVDVAGVEALRDALGAEGATLHVIAAEGGAVAGDGGSLAVDRTVLTTPSVEYDALVVAGGARPTSSGGTPAPP